ncbi:MAG: methyltransferase family protein [Candidatus Hodarchaeota archaeon]
MTVFLINYIIYIRIIIVAKKENNKFRKTYLKIFPIFWAICFGLVPILNSSLLNFIFSKNISFFGKFSIWFLLLGLIFIILGIKINSMAKKLLKDKKSKELEFKLIDEGIYKVMRYPIYTAWILIFIGVNLILDSFIGLILCPILYILVEIKINIEEKLILSPKFGKKLGAYKEKTPYRLFPNPYNYILIIIAILIIYIGFLSLLP